jgi:hypothetical protein
MGMTATDALLVLVTLAVTLFACYALALMWNIIGWHAGLCELSPHVRFWCRPLRLRRRRR